MEIWLPYWKELSLQDAATLIGARLGIRIEQACGRLVDWLAGDRIIARGNLKHTSLGSEETVRRRRYGDRYGAAYAEHVGPIELPAGPFEKVLRWGESPQADSVRVAWPDSEIVVYKLVADRLQELSVIDVRIREADIERLVQGSGSPQKRAKDAPDLDHLSAGRYEAPRSVQPVKARAWGIAEEILNNQETAPAPSHGQLTALADMVQSLLEAEGQKSKPSSIVRYIGPSLKDWNKKHKTS